MMQRAESKRASSFSSPQLLLAIVTTPRGRSQQAQLAQEDRAGKPPQKDMIKDERLRRVGRGGEGGRGSERDRDTAADRTGHHWPSTRTERKSKRNEKTEERGPNGRAKENE
mmetsp:Transcript_8121/g.19946  ORF Transcript_8121/g.19946 Transcript_8121/m.19946 type:complete len:112 (+) Transcript_8121:255-590(+)